MAPSLPGNPDLERFRRDARRLQRGVRAGDARALALVTRHHLRGVADPATFPLAAAQHTVARAHGFTSWPRLVHYLEVAAPLRRDPTAASVDGGPLDTFLTHASLFYGEGDGPERWAEAARLLAQHPELPTRSPYAAAAAGDPDALRAHLAADPGVARSEGGPFRWTPLLYLAYSRVPQRDPLETARLLLDAGADPDAGYLWLGLPTPFTALTGCFGEGEQGPGRQPRHPQGEELARLLLERGAEANDGQTLYNRMFGRDDSHLRLLLEFGLGAGDGGVWHRRLGEALESPAQMLRRQVDWARDHGFTARLDLLARSGFTEGSPAHAPSPWAGRPGAPAVAHVGTPEGVRALAASGGDVGARFEGRTALHHFAWIGDVEMVQALLAAGADPDAVDDEHGTTPLGWAEYGHADAAAALLRPVTRRS